MASQRRLMFCSQCGRQRLFRKAPMDHRFHLALSLGTLGLWLPGWLGFYVQHSIKPWKCPACRKSQILLVFDYRSRLARSKNINPDAV